MMKIKLECDIPLRRATVYLRIKRDVKRQDIQDFLNGIWKPIDNAAVKIERGIRNYLRKIGLYDDSGHLTRAGNTAKETGMVAEFEEGKYKIWYTPDDLSVDKSIRNKIYYFSRVSPSEGKPSIKELDLKFNNVDKDHHCLPTTSWNKEYFSFSVVRPENGFAGSENSGMCKIHLTRSIEESSAADNYSGEFDQNTRILDKQIPRNNEELYILIKDILPDEWDDINRRCRIPFSVFHEKSDEGLFTFLRNHSLTKKYKGYQVNIENLPLEPANIEEAVLWRNLLLDHELSNVYFHPKDFESKILEANRKEGFRAYFGGLDTPKAEEFREIITPSKKSETGPAFWHISAPLDLDPALPQHFIADSFELTQGEKINSREIAEKITTNIPSAVFYYDQYVLNAWQQKAARAFLQSFSCSSIYVITNTAEQRGDILSKDQYLKQIDIKTIFTAGKPQHDRYLILGFQRSLEIWNISNSAGYIRFNDSNVTPNTDGTMFDTVSFHKIRTEKNVLNKQLMNFIEQEIKNV
jgi:hypothetical protein